MNGDYQAYLFVAGFLTISILFPIIPILLAKLWAQTFSPPKPGPEKNDIYECGLKASGEAWIRYRSDFYLYAILFLIFDVETVFLLPFAVSFLHLPLGAVVAMLIFLVLFMEGLVWAWRKGVLNWK